MEAPFGMPVTSLLYLAIFTAQQKSINRKTHLSSKKKKKKDSSALCSTVATYVTLIQGQGYGYLIRWYGAHESRSARTSSPTKSGVFSWSASMPVHRCYPRSWKNTNTASPLEVEKYNLMVGGFKYFLIKGGWSKSSPATGDVTGGTGTE